MPSQVPSCPCGFDKPLRTGRVVWPLAVGSPSLWAQPCEPRGSGWGAVSAASCSLLSLQDPGLQLCLVQSVCMVCQAICSSAQAGSFHFARKAELVAQMMVRPCGSGVPGAAGGL